MKRRRFFAMLAGLPLIGGWFSARATDFSTVEHTWISGEIGQRGPVPHEFVDKFGVQEADSFEGFSADSIIVEGEDGRPYRLSEVLRGMFRMTEQLWTSRKK